MNQSDPQPTKNNSHSKIKKTNKHLANKDLQ
jgi:hypothetical protein